MKLHMEKRKALAGLLLACLCAGAAVSTRGRLLSRRADLDLSVSKNVAGLPEAELGSTSTSRLVVASAALGVFRALAIDYLWIRAVSLQDRGVFFESAALVGLITRLQPRLPLVWTFLARNLAYNISASMPPQERFPWILEGIELLREQALLYNPGNPVILGELAFFFQHKIGLDFDDAGYLYRSRLAESFAIDQESPGYRALLEQWGIEPEHLARVEADWGFELDFRLAESHALYWAELGRVDDGVAADAFTRRSLDIVIRSAILQLFTGGRPVKSAFGPVRIFVPDLRLDGPVRRVLALERERVRNRPAAEALVEEVTLGHLGRLVFFRFLYGEEEEARDVLRRNRARIAPSSPSLEEYLVANVAFLTELEEEHSEPPLPQDPRAKALRSLVACLDTAFLLEVAGETRLAGGFRRLGRLVYARRLSSPAGESAAVHPFERYLEETVRWRVARWRERPEVRQRMPRPLEARWTGSQSEAGALSLPHPDALPFRAELLDPLCVPE